MFVLNRMEAEPSEGTLPTSARFHRKHQLGPLPLRAEKEQAGHLQ